MSHETADQRLSRIQTCWTVVCQASERTAEAAAAQEELLRRYGRAVHRYLLASLRDPDAAEELGRSSPCDSSAATSTGPTPSAAVSAISSRACSSI